MRLGNMGRWQRFVMSQIPRRYRERLNELLFAGSVGVALGWAAAHWDSQTFSGIHEIRATTDKQERCHVPNIPDGQALPIDHSALSLGVPGSTHIVVKEGFVLAYDWRTRNPRWVIQSLDKQNVQMRKIKNAGSSASLVKIQHSNGDAGKQSSISRQQVQFAEDKNAPVPFRTTSKDFQESRFDRGHLAPAGDAVTQAALAETFVLSNVSPQVGSGFNRDYWNRFEAFVRNLTQQNDEVYVATGPLFLPQQQSSNYGGWNVSYDVIGRGSPPALAVPTHFFKSIVCVRSRNGRKQFSTASFIVPNRPIEKGASFQTFQVPLADLETKAGLQLWTRVTDRHSMPSLCVGDVCRLPAPRSFKRERSSSQTPN